MDKTSIQRGEIEQALSQLLTQIQQERQRLCAGTASTDLASTIKSWEDQLQTITAHLLLEKQGRVDRLYEVSHTINESLDWRHTLRAVMNAVIRLTDAERGMILAYDQDDELQIEIKSNGTDEPFTEADVEFSYSVVERALERQRPILTTNAQVDPRFSRSESIIAYGLRSILCAPLLEDDRLLGVIYLDNRAQAGVFTQDDLKLLSRFARHASTAIANAHQLRRTNEQLAERVRELTLLQEMARDLNSSLRFERVMERSLAWAVAAGGADCGAIGLVAEEGLRWASVVGETRPDTAFAMRSIQQRAPLLEGNRLVLPLLRKERPIGAVYLRTKRGVEFENRLDFVIQVADNAAIAVENARLYEALRQTNDAKSEFVSLVSHELRTPMTSIRGYADMLTQERAGALNAQQQAFVETIQRNAERMHILVSDLLDISRIETGRLELNVEATEIRTSVNRALETVTEMIRERNHKLAIDVQKSLPNALVDPDRLTQVFINLLSNAAKYTPEQGRITVDVTYSEKDPHFIRCAVSDNGIGIGIEDQVKLFAKFYRVDRPEVHEQPGTGLGLAITKNLIELQGGRIWLQSEPGAGSTFYFTVPVADAI
jgi:signal transduction histidine kinase